MSNADSIVVDTGKRSDGRWLLGGFVVLFGVLLLLVFGGVLLTVDRE